MERKDNGFTALHLGGLALAGAALLMFFAGSDLPNASHEAWFWWLKGAAALTGAAGVAALRKAEKMENKQ